MAEENDKDWIKALIAAFVFGIITVAVMLIYVFAYPIEQRRKKLYFTENSINKCATCPYGYNPSKIFESEEYYYGCQNPQSGDLIHCPTPGRQAKWPIRPDELVIGYARGVGQKAPVWYLVQNKKLRNPYRVYRRFFDREQNCQLDNPDPVISGQKRIASCRGFPEKLITREKEFVIDV